MIESLPRCISRMNMYINVAKRTREHTLHTSVVRRVRKDPSAYGLDGRRISSWQVGRGGASAGGPAEEAPLLVAP
jgi:hypothetical protein